MIQCEYGIDSTSEKRCGNPATHKLLVPYDFHMRPVYRLCSAHAGAVGDRVKPYIRELSSA